MVGRIVIIGAGPTGLGAAHRLTELGHTDFTVYDRNPYVGGLATSFHDEKGFTWDLAVHVAHSHYTYVDRLMDSLLPDGFYHHIRKSWVREYGKFIPYPFQYNIRHLPGESTWDCVKGLLDLQANGGPAAVANFEEWILKSFGAGIARHFMFPYNRKVWRTEPARMGYQWIGDRVPTLDFNRVLRNIALEQDDVSWGPNATFQFPKSGGTGAIWNKLAERIPADHLRLSCAVTGLDVKNRTLTLADGSTDRYDHLISTLPLTVLAGLTGVAALADRARGLQHTHVDVVGLACPFPIPESLSDKTWIYCPEESCTFYRVTPFSIFSPRHVPDPAQWCSFLIEFSYPGGARPSRDHLVSTAIRELAAIGLVECDPARVHTHLMSTEFGYPVPTLDRDAILNDVLPALEEFQVYSRGRFGGWKYEVANMDHSIMQGVEVVDRLLHGTPEVTLFHPAQVNAGKR
jgi:protoporphyrinogen oxidase